MGSQPHRLMTIQTFGAQRRPTLSPSYAAMAQSPLSPPPRLRTPTRRSPTLSVDELRREVALMVG